MCRNPSPFGHFFDLVKRLKGVLFDLEQFDGARTADADEVAIIGANAYLVGILETKATFC